MHLIKKKNLKIIFFTFFTYTSQILSHFSSGTVKKLGWLKGGKKHNFE